MNSRAWTGYGEISTKVGARQDVATFCAQARPQHLRRIFAKVGAAGRGELVASLFFERGE